MPKVHAGRRRHVRQGPPRPPCRDHARRDQRRPARRRDARAADHLHGDGADDPARHRREPARCRGARPGSRASGSSSPCRSTTGRRARCSSATSRPRRRARRSASARRWRRSPTSRSTCGRRRRAAPGSDGRLRSPEGRRRRNGRPRREGAGRAVGACGTSRNSCSGVLARLDTRPTRRRRSVSLLAPPSLVEFRRASPKPGGGGTEPGCGRSPTLNGRQRRASRSPAGAGRAAADGCVSALAHAGAAALLIVARPAGSRRPRRPADGDDDLPRRRPAGPRSGGMTAIGGRARAGRRAARGAEAARAGPAAGRERRRMTVPAPDAPRRRPGADVKQAPDDARGTTPTRGAEVTRGTAVAETGVRGRASACRPAAARVRIGSTSAISAVRTTSR